MAVAEGDYDPENDSITDPFCRIVNATVAEAVAHIATLEGEISMLSREVSREQTLRLRLRSLLDENESYLKVQLAADDAARAASSVAPARCAKCAGVGTIEVPDFDEGVVSGLSDRPCPACSSRGVSEVARVKMGESNDAR